MKDISNHKPRNKPNLDALAMTVSDSMAESPSLAFAMGCLGHAFGEDEADSFAYHLDLADLIGIEIRRRIKAKALDMLNEAQAARESRHDEV